MRDRRLHSSGAQRCPQLRQRRCAADRQDAEEQDEGDGNQENARE